MKSKGFAPPPRKADLYCPQCGYTDVRWRQGLRSYICRHCGYSWKRGEGLPQKDEKG